MTIEAIKQLAWRVQRPFWRWWYNTDGSHRKPRSHLTPQATERPAEMKGYYNEQVKLRVFQMPCCKQVLCWVNPRLPNKCPECGHEILHAMRTGEFTLKECDAWMRYKE